MQVVKGINKYKESNAIVKCLEKAIRYKCIQAFRFLKMDVWGLATINTPHNHPRHVVSFRMPCDHFGVLQPWNLTLLLMRPFILRIASDD